MTETVRTAELVSVVIPVYNSPSLEALVHRIASAFEGRSERFEIILVDDGSTDPAVWPALDSLARGGQSIRAVQLTRNFGQQAATLCGMREARGDVVITMDDDLQHDPADIPLLLAQREHDIVIGQLVRSEHGPFRRLASTAKGLFDRAIIGIPKGVRLSSFRLLRRTVVDGILTMRATHPFLPALMFHVSKDVVGVPVTHSRRPSGRSGYTFSRLLRLFSNLVISNSSILLRVAAFAGLLLACVSFGLAAAVIYRKIVHGISVQGWTSLFASTLLIGGAVLMSVGVIGEYLIRIIESSDSRPIYFIRRRAGNCPET